MSIDEPVVFLKDQTLRMVEILLGDDNAPERIDSFYVELYLPDDETNSEIIGIERAQTTIFDDETFVDEEDEEGAC